MKAALSLVLLSVVAVGSVGCLAKAAVVSTEKNAYVVKGNLFGSNMFHCKAEPKPVCTQVEESE
ncbi:MAG: hypothetical protein R3B70_38435 [Polyangiaceae bacterium]